jgi:hypothetical protein
LRSNWLRASPSLTVTGAVQVAPPSAELVSLISIAPPSAGCRSQVA